jgi:hypothetical protein
MKQKEYADPTKYMPMQFVVDVEIDAANTALGLLPGDSGRGQVMINDRPFLITQITHQRIWPAAMPDTLWGTQDGGYRIDWSEYEQIRFWKGAIPLADIAFGSVRDGNWIPFPAPIPLPGKQTLHVTVTNALARGAPPAVTTMYVEIIFHGLQARTKTIEGAVSPELEG